MEKNLKDDSIHVLDLLLQSFRDRVPIISDKYLERCAKYFDLEAMYRPDAKPSDPKKKEVRV